MDTVIGRTAFFCSFSPFRFCKMFYHGNRKTGEGEETPLPHIAHEGKWTIPKPFEGHSRSHS